MNFLVTSFLFTNESIQACSAMWGQAGHVKIFSRTSIATLHRARDIIKAKWYDDGEVAVACSVFESNIAIDQSASAQKLLSYYNRSLTVDREDINSCVVLDSTRNLLWLSADSIGATPLWYSFSSGQFAASTDLLSLYHMGLTEPSSVMAGHTLVIDLVSQEITQVITHTKEDKQTTEKSESYTQIPEVYARKVLIKAVDVLPSFVGESIVTVEVDPLDSSSLLLDCALDALNINRAVWDTKPLVSDEFTAAEDTIYWKIIGRYFSNHIRK